jgi:hypothetical protein
MAALRTHLFNPLDTNVSLDRICFPNAAFCYQKSQVSCDRKDQLERFGFLLRENVSCLQALAKIKAYMNKFNREPEEIRLVMRLMCHISHLNDAEYDEVRMQFSILFPPNPDLTTSGRGRTLSYYNRVFFLWQTDIRHVIIGFLSGNVYRQSSLTTWWKKTGVTVKRNTNLYDCHVCIAGVLAQSFLQPHVRVFQTQESYGVMGLKLLRHDNVGQLIAIAHLFPTQLLTLTGLEHDRFRKDGYGLFGMGFAINSKAKCNVNGIHNRVCVGEFKGGAEAMKFFLPIVEFVALNDFTCNDKTVELFWTYGNYI